MLVAGHLHATANLGAAHALAAAGVADAYLGCGRLRRRGAQFAILFGADIFGAGDVAATSRFIARYLRATFHLGTGHARTAQRGAYFDFGWRARLGTHPAAGPTRGVIAAPLLAQRFTAGACCIAAVHHTGFAAIWDIGCRYGRSRFRVSRCGGGQRSTPSLCTRRPRHAGFAVLRHSLTPRTGQ